MTLDEARKALLHYTPNGCSEALDLVLAELDRRADEITELGSKVVALSQGEVCEQWRVRDGWLLPIGKPQPYRVWAQAIADEHGPAAAVWKREIRTSPWNEVAS